jgi:hypothetical protein
VRWLTGGSASLTREPCILAHPGQEMTLEFYAHLLSLDNFTRLLERKPDAAQARA